MNTLVRHTLAFTVATTIAIVGCDPASGGPAAESSDGGAGAPGPGPNPDPGPAGPGADGSAPGGPLDEQSFADRYCALISRCCTSVGAQAGPMPCADLKLLQASAKTTKFDPVYAEQCITGLTTYLDRPDACIGLLRPAACWAAYREAPAGRTPTGGPCASTDDCAPKDGGLVKCNFIGGDAGTAEACTFIPDGKLGDACSADVQGSGYVGINGGGTAAGCRLEDGLFCDPNTGKCAALLAVGATCNGESRIVTSGGYARLRWPCVPDATCDDKVHECVARNAAGASCDPALPSTCLDNAWCDPAQSKCVRKLDATTACTTNASCASNACGSGGTCTRGIHDVICLP